MRSRGIALITTLMMSGLLLILLGAFMTLQRNQFSLLGGGGDRESALRTVISAHEYCVNRIERDKSWGASDFTAEFEDPELAGFMRVKELESSRDLEGSIPSLDSTFEVTVDNNLAEPENTVVLTITAHVGTLSRTVISTLRPAPLYDSAISAGGAIQVSAAEWTVGSRDPYRNLVRAKGNIDAPDHAVVDFVGKPNTAGETGNDEGIFWAKDDISFFIGGSAESVTDPTVLQDAIANTGGMFFPNSGVNHSIHELQADDVVTPSNTTSIQDGEYRFTTTNATYENWEIIGYDSFGSPNYGWVPRNRVIPIMGRYAGALTDFWYTTASLPSTIQNLDLGLPGTDHPQVTETFTLDAGAQVEVTLDMPATQPAFRILADGQVKIPGTFKVTSDGDEPILSFSGAGGDSQIEAEGDVEFEGELNGNGIVISKNGSVTLNITNANTSGNDLGVSVFANNDILINSIGSGHLNFSGLVYAKENVMVNGVNQDFNVDGALVARNGDIQITTGGKVDLTYNPEHLGTLMENLPENRTKLENLIWKE